MRQGSLGGVTGEPGERTSECTWMWPPPEAHTGWSALRMCIYIRICIYVHALVRPQLCCIDWQTRTREQTLREISFCISTVLLLPRPQPPPRVSTVAEGVSSLLPICSYSQQLKSLRSAAISSHLSHCNCGGAESQGLTVAICTCTQEGQLQCYTLLLPINRSMSDLQGKATEREGIDQAAGPVQTYEC